MARSGSRAASTAGAGSTKRSGTAAKAAGAKKISAASSASVKPRSTATGTTGTAKRTAKPAAKATGPAAKKPLAKTAKNPAKAAAKTASKSTGKASAVGATKSAAKKPAKSPAKSPAKKTSTSKAAKAAASGGRASRPSRSRATLAVKDDETPWTKEEIAEVRGELKTDRDRLRSELNLAEEELADLMRDAGDGAGNDQADVGSTTFERDHEMSLANNARVMLAQTERALGRLDDGSYGICESCGQPIGKNRLMAFPRATLCLSCKQREERR
jgi:RNA polymerase-binding protein DksA